MMKSCVTLSLVPEAKGGPFIFWDDLAGACEEAAKLGFDAVEIFAPGPESIDVPALQAILQRNGLSVAAFGTGGGWIKHKLTLTSPSAEVRQRARDFVKSMSDLAANFDAAVIVGSMQGRFDGAVSRSQALDYLGEALRELAEGPATILYEHLNRYETNLLNRIEDVMPFVSGLPTNVKILADLFHMSIEEADISSALRGAASRLGHVHLADSNRRPAGGGHTDFEPIFSTLRAIHYSGYLSAEALPFPDPMSAARQTIQAIQRYRGA